MIPVITPEQQAVVIEVAIAAGVKSFIPREFGPDAEVVLIDIAILAEARLTHTQYDQVIAGVPFFGAKRKCLDYLRSKQDIIR